MTTSTALLALGLPVLGLLVSGSAAACDQVHLFLARGNNEPYPGRQRNIVNAVCGQLAGCGYEDIIFTAGEEQVFCDTAHQGALNGQAQIVAYAQRCPSAQLVLTGYSQGALIAGDILGGGGDATIFNCALASSDALSPTSDVGSRLKAITIFGDVRHTAGQSYNVLDGADGDGLAPRSGTLLTNLNKWSDRLRSYCAAGDPVCAGGNITADHLNYFDLYSDAAATWIVSKLSSVTTTSTWSAVPTSVSGTVEDYATTYTTTDHPSPSVTPNLDVTITTSGAASSTSGSSSSSKSSASSKSSSSTSSGSSSSSTSSHSTSAASTSKASTDSTIASSGSTAQATPASATASASSIRTASSTASASSTSATSGAGRLTVGVFAGIVALLAL